MTKPGPMLHSEDFEAVFNAKHSHSSQIIDNTIQVSNSFADVHESAIISQCFITAAGYSVKTEVQNFLINTEICCLKETYCVIR